MPWALLPLALAASGKRNPTGKRVHGRVVVVQGDADLLQVVRALDAPGGLAGRLDGGQQQGDQHGDDRDHDQQLDQCEGSTMMHGYLLSKKKFSLPRYG